VENALLAQSYNDQERMDFFESIICLPVDSFNLMDYHACK